MSGATIQDVRVYARQLAESEVASLAKLFVVCSRRHAT